MSFSDLFIFGLCAHIVADWFLQNDWMAQHKTKWLHPAAWIHSGLHFACCVPVFGWFGAYCVFMTHFLIDLRTPLIWWRKAYGIKMNDPKQEPHSIWNQVAMHVAFWQDQMAHVLIIAIVAYFLRSQ